MRALIVIILLSALVFGSAWYLSNRSIDYGKLEGLNGPIEVASSQISVPGEYRLSYSIDNGWGIVVKEYEPVWNGSVNIVANSVNAVNVTTPFIFGKTDYVLVPYNACILGSVQAGPFIILKSLSPLVPGTQCQSVQYIGPSQAVINTDDPNVATTMTSNYIRIEANVPSGTFAYEEITLGTFTNNSIVLLFNATPVQGAVGLDFYVNSGTKITVNANGDYNYIALSYQLGTTAYNVKIPYTETPVPLVLVYNPSGTYSIYFNGHYVGDMNGNGAPGSVKLVVRNLLNTVNASAVFYAAGVFGLDDPIIPGNLSLGVAVESDGPYRLEPSYIGDDTTVLVSPGHYIEASGYTGEDAVQLPSGTYNVTLYPKNIVIDVPGYYIVSTGNETLSYTGPVSVSYLAVKDGNLTVYANGTASVDLELVQGRDFLKVYVKKDGVGVDGAYVYLYSGDGVLLASNVTGSDGSTTLLDAPSEGSIYVYAYYDSFLLQGYTEYSTASSSTEQVPDSSTPNQTIIIQRVKGVSEQTVLLLLLGTIILVTVIAVVFALRGG